MKKFHWKLFLSMLYCDFALKCPRFLLFSTRIQAANWHPCTQTKTTRCSSNSLRAICCEFKLLLVTCNLLLLSFSWPVFYLWPHQFSSLSLLMSVVREDHLFSYLSKPPSSFCRNDLSVQVENFSKIYAASPTGESFSPQPNSGEGESYYSCLALQYFSGS